MFKKLKEKITEEVKSSPQRFQQLTQSVSDKLQGTNTPDENLFSIGEDDANTSNMSSDQGFSSVTLVSPSTENRSRRMSNSSIASDVSFLPRYEASSLYHLQSDLDDSVSELEDNVSQSSSQLGHLSKEQLYNAFQKSQMRYHKYRGRYTDLARHYKELERENGKMKSVLVETQDKAIRRVTELKEQCSLEQKAKAHLESALRDELDEKEMKIQSLQTKINLQGKGDSESLIDLDKKETTNHVDSDKLEQLTKYLNDARHEIEALNNKIQEYKASTIIFQTKEQEYKAKIVNLEKDIASFSEREKENNIKLAENKMELHNELLSKDSEINKLKKEIETLKSNLSAQEKDAKSTKLENLQTQNSKLIEKVENLTQKCNGLENELLKIEKYKIEIRELTDKNLELSESLEEEKVLRDRVQELIDENNQLQNVIEALKVGLRTCQGDLKRLIEEKNDLINTIGKEKQEYENQIETLRDSAKKGLFTLEKQISERLRESYEEKENALKKEFEAKLEEISSSNNTAKGMHLQIVEKDNLIRNISEELQDVRNKLFEKDSRYRELEDNHLALIEESNQLRSSVSKLEKQVAELGNETNKVNEEKIERLQANIKTLQEELIQLQKINHDKEKDNIQLAQDLSHLETINEQLLQNVRLLEEKQTAEELDTTESNLLELKVQTLEEEKKSLLDGFENERKMFNELIEEHKELKIKEANIEELENRNKKLEEKIVTLKGYLNEKEDRIVELNKIRLDLEQQISKASENIRINEEHEEAIKMDITECNLLQIKVQQLENEKENLIKSFEKEREVFDHTFHKKNEEFDSHKEEIMNDNISLAKEVLNLKVVNTELSEKVRLFEEKDQAVELETAECNLLKLKVQELEKERIELLSSFENEREMFNTILEEHKDLKLKEELIKDLESSNHHLTEKLAEYKDYLEKKEESIVELNKVKLDLEHELTKLKESLRIKEEEMNSLEIDKTECQLLEMKLQKLEEEKQALLDQFEEERTVMQEALEQSSHAVNKIEGLTKEIEGLKKEKDELIEKEKKLVKSLESEKHQFEQVDKELRELREANNLLKEAKEQLNNKLKEQSERTTGEIVRLQNEVDGLKKERDSVQKVLDEKENYISELAQVIERQKLTIEDQEKKFVSDAEVLEKEKVARKKAVLKLKEMIVEQNKNKDEIKEIKNALETVEKLYAEATSKQSVEGQVLEETKRKLYDVENEKLRLEKELRKKTDEFNFKAKEMTVIEQQFSILTQDKETLSQENKQLRERIFELTQECEQLRNLASKVKELDQCKKQNEVLQNQCDKLNQEISELKVRINQLSSDNRYVNEEHDRLITEVQEYKIRNEFLENEKGAFENIKSKLEDERNSLQVSISELNEKLQQSHKDLENATKTSTSVPNDLDLVQIQKDFLEIKEKCDNLCVENKNLKAEYTKLEEQCSNFSKVKKDLENQLTELERHYNEVLHEKQLLQDEVHELKIAPINASSSCSSTSGSSTKLDNLSIIKHEKSLQSTVPNGPAAENQQLLKEIDTLQEKITRYKSLDMTNKSSIEFYENELHKMKSKNEKLSRKLDETLVTLNHCAELSSSTEIEYLRNVLYNYMLGKESLVLARVIAAVCKFDPNQTEAVLQKEQQKQTLLGQLGIL